MRLNAGAAIFCELASISTDRHTSIVARLKSKLGSNTKLDRATLIARHRIATRTARLPALSVASHLRGSRLPDVAQP